MCVEELLQHIDTRPRTWTAWAQETLVHSPVRWLRQRVIGADDAVPPSRWAVRSVLRCTASLALSRIRRLIVNPMVDAVVSVDDIANAVGLGADDAALLVSQLVRDGSALPVEPVDLAASRHGVRGDTVGTTVLAAAAPANPMVFVKIAVSPTATVSRVSATDRAVASVKRAIAMVSRSVDALGQQAEQLRAAAAAPRPPLVLGA